jgi:hypothetical protein
MSINSIPDNLVITPAMEGEGWRLFARSYGIGEGPAPSAEQLELADILMHAGEMHRTTNVWPTFSQATENLSDKWDRRLKRDSRANAFHAENREIK